MKQHEWFEQALSQTKQKAKAHRERCRALPPLRPGEVDRLVAEFLANRVVTQCPTMFVTTVSQADCREPTLRTVR